MKISSLYGKKISGAAGEGYVISVCAEENELCCLVCADENEREFAVAAAGIKNVKDKIIYKSSAAKKCGKPLKLGKPVFDGAGEYFGKLTDFTVEQNKLVFAHVGNKKFSCEDIIAGDAVIIKGSARVLKSDVKSGGKVLIRRGTPLTPEVLEKAQKKGEYVQTNLKTI